MEKNTILIDGDKLSVNANGFELSVDCRHDDLLPKGAKERIVSMYAAGKTAYTLTPQEYAEMNNCAVYGGFICTPTIYVDKENKILPIFMGNPLSYGLDGYFGLDGETLTFLHGGAWHTKSGASADDEKKFPALAAMIAYILNGCRKVHDCFCVCDCCPRGFEDAGLIEGDYFNQLVERGIIPPYYKG